MLKDTLIRLEILLLALGCLGRPLEAQIIKKGQVGFRFLDNPISAEAIGRGGLGSTTLRNANAVFWNPSGLAWMAGRANFNTSYTLGIADINYSAAAFAARLAGWGIMAIDIFSMDYGRLQGTRRADNERGFVETGAFTPTALSAGITYSRKVSDRFSFGIRCQYATQYLGSPWVATSGSSLQDTALVITTRDYTLGEPALDVGTTYDFLKHGLRFGAVLQNFSREIKYERETFPLPFNVGFSLSLKPLHLLGKQDPDRDLLVGFETQHPRDYREKIRLGAEFTYQRILILRTGYMANYDERGLTLGCGIRQSRPGVRVQVDYAYQDFGLFKGVHTLSLGLVY